MSPRRSEHFAAIPLRFFYEWQAQELDALHVLVALYLVARCHEVVNTAAGVAVIRLAEIAELCGVDDETIRRRLHDLRDAAWVGFDDPRTGPGSRWRVWLTGLALRRASEPPPRLDPITSHEETAERRLISSDAGLTATAIPHEFGHREVAESPLASSPVPTDETRRNETTATLGNGTTLHALIGGEGYLPFLFAAFERGLITEGEWRQGDLAHRFVAHRELELRDRDQGSRTA